MGVSERHTKCLLAPYHKHGAATLVPDTAAAAVLKLASNGYAGTNHSHFTELLR